jgi:hypothetical protein
VVLFAAAPNAMAADRKSDVRYGEPAAWVKAPPPPTEAAAPADAPLRFSYSDRQVRILPTGTEAYNAFHVRILKPEGLPIGNVTISWNPSSDDATVHRVQIIRQGQVIDVLKGTRFRIVQREGALEQSILTGTLTAALQVPGLQVGDELAVATTLRSRDPTLGDQSFGLFVFPQQGLPGAFRYRLSWPDGMKVSFKGSRDLAAALPVHEGRDNVISYELRDPRGVIVNDGAPGRFNVRRLVEYSTFPAWLDASRRFWPLFDQAAKLAPSSPLRGEAAKIAAASNDPAIRAMAALQKVQNEVRYVYVGLDGGNYHPASADETWARRFGDCKAKTVVLLALLREMGIEAEAVLVNATGDDGIDARLPSPSMFNHVLVRAKIENKTHWLDGTRLGDRYLDMLPAPSFAWALPIRQDGADLKSVPPTAFTRPQSIGVMDLDASGGFDRPARVSMRYVLRGDEAFSLRTNLAALSGEDAQRALRSYWRQQENWVEPDSVDWRYDERSKTIRLSVAGTGRPDWSGNDKNGHSLTIWGAGFSPPDILRRPREQDASAPWLTDFPRFRCWASTIRLPKPNGGRTWSFEADAMNRKIGGVIYWRQAGMHGEIVRTVMSRSVELSEISSEQAKAQNDAIAGFNNNMSSVFEVAGGPPKPSEGRLPFADGVDWAEDDSACIARPLN